MMMPSFSLLLLILWCRLVCLRIHPTFTLLHPMETFVSFTSIDGSKHEIRPEYGDQFYEGNLLPNGNHAFPLFYFLMLLLQFTVSFSFCFYSLQSQSIWETKENLDQYKRWTSWPKTMCLLSNLSSLFDYEYVYLDFVVFVIKLMLDFPWVFWQSRYTAIWTRRVLLVPILV